MYRFKLLEWVDWFSDGLNSSQAELGQYRYVIREYAYEKFEAYRVNKTDKTILELGSHYTKLIDAKGWCQYNLAQEVLWALECIESNN